MSNFFYGFAIPVLAVIVAVLFSINAQISSAAKSLKEIKAVLSKGRTDKSE